MSTLPRPKGAYRNGFTFIELNIVVILVAVMALTTYGAFAAGTRIWQRSRDFLPQAGAHIFMDTLSADLRNSLRFSAIPWRGSSKDLSFAAFSYHAGAGTAGFGRVDYSFDGNEGVISRQYQAFPVAADAAGQERPRPIVAQVTTCSFTYYYFNRASRTGEWRSSFDGDLPTAVRVEFSVTANKRTVLFSKIIGIHIG